MICLEKAPEKGMLYAVYTDQVVYRQYETLPTLQELEKDTLLELHMFDGEMEYRCIKSRMRGMIETVINDDIEHDDSYREQVYVSGENVDKQEHLTEKIEIVNYITYDENDLLQIRNYRFREVR